MSIASAPTLLERFQQIRSLTEEICQPLAIEDYVIQSMPDCSPTRWHLAHTSWFFETFILAKQIDGYVSPNPAFEFLFNSYYNAVGDQYPRMKRGILSRPTVQEIYDYRQAVDRHMHALLSDSIDDALQSVVEIGIHHEQQHQELMLTDIKHVFGQNPLFPKYLDDDTLHNTSDMPQKLDWVEFQAGSTKIGHRDASFCYDNELPVFETLLQDYALANRLITNHEFQAFMDDGGYERPELWLSMGWSTVQSESWKSPFYWYLHNHEWHEFTMHGLRPVLATAPVTHLSYFEADAYARWADARLPTEFEWEHASRTVPIEGNFVDDRRYHPQPASPGDGLRQMFGDTWEWTSSQYTPYPGYKAAPGALGEYNGKFMCNQFVLRGGSCATSANHIRPTYRNFFPPEARWQFTGLRLAR